MDPEAIALESLQKVMARGASEAEICAKKGGSLTIRRVSGNEDYIQRADESGLGIRVWAGGNGPAFLYNSGWNLDNNRIDETIARAARLPLTVSLPTLSRTGPGNPGTDGDEGSFKAQDLEKGIAFLKSTERELAGREGLRAEYILLTMGESETSLANSRGFIGSYRKGALYEVLSLIVEKKGATISGYAMDAGRSLEDLEPSILLSETADRLSISLEGKTAPTGDFELLLEPFAVSHLLGILSRGCLGSTAPRIRATPPPALRRVSSPLISITDDATLEEGLSSFPFDGEGVPGQKTRIVVNGIIENLLHDSRSAESHKTESTGNAIRRSYRDPPEAGITNFFIEPGNPDPEELRSSVNEGLLVRDITSIQEGRGREGLILASGEWIRKGKALYPVSRAFIRSDISGILRRVVGIGNNLRYFHGQEGSIGSPTLLCGGVTLEG